MPRGRTPAWTRAPPGGKRHSSRALPACSGGWQSPAESQPNSAIRGGLGRSHSASGMRAQRASLRRESRQDRSRHLAGRQAVEGLAGLGVADVAQHTTWMQPLASDGLVNAILQPASAQYRSLKDRAIQCHVRCRREGGLPALHGERVVDALDDPPIATVGLWAGPLSQDVVEHLVADRLPLPRPAMACCGSFARRLEPQAAHHAVRQHQAVELLPHRRW